METLKAINNRKSVRSYTGALTDEALQTILKAGEESPIGRAQYDTPPCCALKRNSTPH